jgi:ArsR family transcriptional regulator
MIPEEAGKGRAGMENQYVRMAKVFRALSDPKRVKIVDMLSCGEMCGCVLLKCFEITQPTLAHDMKVLSEAGIVTSRREGKKTYYALNRELLEKVSVRLREMLKEEPKNGKSPE